MPTPLRFIRKRIRSVKSTRQVTKAMEAVSASKMRKAVGITLASRSYAESGWEVVKTLRLRGVSDHPFLKDTYGGKILVVLITSDRGLCGGLNAQLIKKVFDAFHKSDFDILAIGKKGSQATARFRKNILAVFSGLTDRPSVVQIRPVFHLIQKEYTEGHYQKVYVAFSHFRSALEQVPVLEQLLPVEIPQNIPTFSSEYIFEPDAQTVLSFMLPRLLETKIYQAILETSASEHSARMVTMRNATDNANNLISDLSLTYNQARQAMITQEIAEISAGRAALE